MTTSRRAEPLTMFSWGYEGWGSSVPELLASTEAVERGRGFGPPVFVDVRVRRGARAAGFRDKAFERALGPGRYHWIQKLGNDAVRTGSGGLRIADSTAVSELLEVAKDAASRNCRVLFFCACAADFGGCHRHEVARLAVKYATRHKIPLVITAWPGGEPAEEPAATISVPRTFLRALNPEQVPRTVTIDAKLASRAAAWPWGTLVVADAGTEQAVLATGPALARAGRWVLPILSYGWDCAADELGAYTAPIRKQCGLLPLRSKG